MATPCSISPVCWSRRPCFEKEMNNLISPIFLGSLKSGAILPPGRIDVNLGPPPKQNAHDIGVTSKCCNL